MSWPEVVIKLPGWVEGFAGSYGGSLDTVEGRMDFVIALAGENIRRETGGPFGAAVFESRTGKLVAPGVNIVTSINCSIAHAEMVAISVAQKSVGSFDLSGGYELYTSCEPCAMCLGAIPWSGVRSLYCAARDEDARSVGFDEGVKPEGWVDVLVRGGMEVVTDVRRGEAVKVLQSYIDGGGTIYNGGAG